MSLDINSNPAKVTYSKRVFPNLKKVWYVSKVPIIEEHSLTHYLKCCRIHGCRSISKENRLMTRTKLFQSQHSFSKIGAFSRKAHG